jgi:hypothetical protein
MNETSWRNCAKSFTEIGRCMEKIERNLREIQAINAIDEYGSREAIYAIRAAANKIASEANSMIFFLKEKQS